MLTSCSCGPGSHQSWCPFNPTSIRIIPSEVYYMPPINLNTTPKGWLCPRCQVVNAPWVEKCECAPMSYTITWTSQPPFDCRISSTGQPPINRMSSTGQPISSITSICSSNQIEQKPKRKSRDTIPAFSFPKPTIDIFYYDGKIAGRSDN